MDDARPPLPIWKRALFATVAVAVFFGVLEGVLALAGVRPVLDTEDPYVGFAGAPLFVAEPQADGSTRMVTANNKRTYFNLQSFAMPKPAGTFRAFAVGGSTTYGHPYDDRTSFSAWMRELLQTADPSHPWEVVNAGGVSYASYRDAALLEEFAKYDPDLFIVYGSQNEFLERRTYAGLIEASPAVNRVGALASRTRAYTAIRGAVNRARTQGVRAARQRYEMTGEVDALLDVVGGLDQYVRDDTLAQRIGSHFEFNLHRMARIARQCGARIVFVMAASNRKDCSPFKSQHDARLDAASVGRVEALLATGALPDLEEAVRIDPRFAAAHYALGRAQLAAGRPAEARASFQRALDEDVCPLRQTSALQAAMRRTARQNGVPLVDYDSLLADVAQARLGQRILGAELFLDHVHPTIEGNAILAGALVEELAREGVVKLDATWPDAALATATRAIDGRMDAALQAQGLRNVARVFAWAGKTTEAGRLLEQAQVLDPQSTEGMVILGSQAVAEHRTADAIRSYEEVLARDPNQAEARNNLAVELSRAGRYDEALAQYEALLKVAPDRWGIHSNAGLAAMQLGRFDVAARHYAEVVRLRPSDAQARLHLGQAEMRGGKPDEAQRALRAALRLAPRDPEVLTAAGTVYAQQGKPDSAAAAFRAALAAKPDHAPAQLYLGTLLWRQEQLPEARAALEQAIALQPAIPEAHNTLGLVLWKQGDLAAAEREFAAELRRDAKHSEARDNLAFVLAAQGKAADAVREYREALRLAPDDPKTLNGLAWLLATHPDPKIRDGKEALRLAQHADDLAHHGHPLVLNTLAAAYAEVGRFDDATRTAEKAMQVARSGGQDPLARQMERMLALYRDHKPFRTAAK